MAEISGMVPSGTAVTVLCCLCGTRTTTPPFCADCLKGQADLAEEVKPTGPLTMCKHCGKWLTKSKHWVAAELESQDLLSLTLKYVQGLSKVKLQDASFIWTEPHCRRIKIRVNAKKEVMHGVDVSQKVDMEFVVKTMQCEDCTRSFTEQTWRALVQVRQRVEHKKTFFFLEQLLIARRMQDHVLDMEIQRDGMDLFFSDKNVAQQFVTFLSGVVPYRSKTSRKMVSEDKQNNVHNNQHTTVVEIVPLCKDDLVLVPPKALSGAVSGLCLVSRVTSVVHLLDPCTLQRVELPAFKYFRSPLKTLFTSKDLIEFEVLDVELLDGQGTDRDAATAASQGQQKGLLAEVEVVKSSDFNVSYRLLTHLGHLLSAGDTVMGYDIRNSVLGGEALEGLKYDPPDVILVKKVVEGRKEKRRLKRLQARRARKASLASGKPVKHAASVADEEEDFAQFAKELEADDDLRELLAEQEAHGLRSEDVMVFFEDDKGTAAGGQGAGMGVVEEGDHDDGEGQDLTGHVAQDGSASKGVEEGLAKLGLK